MENKNYSVEERSSFRIGGGSRNSSVWIGVIFVLAGILILLRRMGLDIPHWIISWQMLLIGIGVIMGLRSGFRDLSWLIPIVIGTIFLSDDFFPGFRFRNFIWPMAIIGIGLIIITKGNRKGMRSNFDAFQTKPKDDLVTGFKRIDETGQKSETSSAGDVPPSIGVDTNDSIECTAIFGGVKRTVVSKNFKGGEIVAIFGGAEVDLTHADIQGVVQLEATNILGGTKLIVPPTWDVQSEMVAILGGVEDKRRIQPELIDRSKRLVLVGTAFLGGLEVKSF
ncbi:MAG TPA: LiaF domain-containing protein [Phnomibacter sp.]|nr:LiaF domain-containing protein [Phnomibacter sp.]